MSDFNAVGWFEIPVIDMDRAIRFYQDALGVKLSRQTIGGLDMALFPMVEAAKGAAGALVENEETHWPSTDGVLVYFTSPTGDLEADLAKVDDAGGTVLLPKTLISKDIGHMAVFMDSEGNRVAIHSRG